MLAPPRSIDQSGQILTNDIKKVWLYSKCIQTGLKIALVRLESVTSNITSCQRLSKLPKNIDQIDSFQNVVSMEATAEMQAAREMQNAVMQSMLLFI